MGLPLINPIPNPTSEDRPGPQDQNWQNATPHSPTPCLVVHKGGRSSILPPELGWLEMAGGKLLQVKIKGLKELSYLTENPLAGEGHCENAWILTTPLCIRF